MPESFRHLAIIPKTLAILLSSRDKSSRPLAGRLHYTPDIHTSILMMIVELEALDYAVRITEIPLQRQIRSDTGNKNQIMRINITLVIILENRLKRTILDRREKNRHALATRSDTLASIHVIITDSQHLGHLYLIPILKIRRTLRHYDDIGMIQSLRKITQPAERKKIILRRRPVVIHENNIEQSLQRTILESIIQDDKILLLNIFILAFTRIGRCLQLFRVQKKFTSLHPRSVYSHRNLRKLTLDLKRLVSSKRRRIIDKNLLETAAAALVAAGEYSDILVVPFFAGKQLAQNHFRVRGLARAACRDITYANRRHITSMHLEHAFIIQSVTNLQRKIVWRQYYSLKHSVQR